MGGVLGESGSLTVLSLLYVEDLDRAFFFLHKTLWVQHERAKVELLVLEAEVIGHKFFD